MATVCWSPTLHLDSQGLPVEAIRVRTSILWWRPMVLKVRVGSQAVMGRMSP